MKHTSSIPGTSDNTVIYWVLMAVLAGIGIVMALVVSGVGLKMIELFSSIGAN